MRLLVAVLLLPLCALALDNGLAITPQMGWNSWNHFGCDISESLIRSTIDALVDTGLLAAGYNYINLDDCWQKSRDTDGNIVPDPDAFPNGIKPLADYAHSKGLLFGLYSDAGYETCQERPGSLGYEVQDANSYASWGVDYLKYDNCHNGHIKPEERYPAMHDALNQTGRVIFFSMCEWGVDQPATWARDIGNSWRTTMDISDNWLMMNKNLLMNDLWADYAGPGGWNDPDMLEVGNDGMTTSEYRAHFSLWCLVKAPLIIGCDITNMSNDTYAILTAPEVIAVNQDPLGVQGRLVSAYAEEEVWGGPLSGGRYVMILYNKRLSAKDMIGYFNHLGIAAGTRWTVRDLWARRDIGVYSDEITITVNSHDVAMFSLTPAN